MQIKTRLVIALLSALSISVAMATTLERLELDELATKATMVVVGEVTAASTKETADGIYTLTTLSVKQTMWGAASDKVTVATPGGSQKIGKIRVGTVTAGTPNLFMGRKVMLFLAEDAAHGGYSIVGFNQGLLDVVQTTAGDAVMLPGAAEATTLQSAASKLREMKTSQSQPAAGARSIQR